MFFSYVSVLPFELPQWKKYSFIIKRWYFWNYFLFEFLCLWEKHTKFFSRAEFCCWIQKRGQILSHKVFSPLYLFLFSKTKTAFSRECFVETEKCFLSRSDCWSRRIHKILFFVAICFIVNHKKISIFFAPSKEKEVFRCNSRIILKEKWTKVF